jgi:3-hydroxyacyl-CoA dehydrogenase/enoyl-CoA hydratase/3-hydroxybutyryl-CoA epimerase
MKLVEIIRGKQTDDETVARAYDYVQAIGKIPIVVNDSRGFFTSRVFGTFVMEGLPCSAKAFPPPPSRTPVSSAACRSARWPCWTRPALTLSLHVMEQTRKDFELEGKTYTVSPGETLITHGAPTQSPGPRRWAGFYEYPA